ncbi:MAG: pyruvate, phosphate dikinase [Spirochaetales bacterium]|nr:pyruvate, phosphate dikinase [Spirochaetales bacterium]MCF7937304.1 pyruvate, phosphate dikinase [Spirochaetales bacterium]
MAQKFVYFFGRGKADGKSAMKDLLGGKGANLAEMTNIGIPVPPGFTISTEVCEWFYDHDKTYPTGLEEEVENNLKKVEEVLNKEFGNPDNPLLVSVRSGAAVSMPGMMDTILNLGLNEEVVEGLARITENERFAWDAYRRFIHMFGNVVKGVPNESFEEKIEALKKKKKYDLDTDLGIEDLKNLVKDYKAVYKKETGQAFPQDPKKQLWMAINAVFGSWNNTKAIKYRKINDIEGLKGTAVNVQSMVYGNFGDTSGTGVCFSRDPSTGKKIFFGEYLMNAQGEDVVAGIRTPMKLTTLKKKNPKIYQQLEEIKDKLEAHYRDMQDIEFTIQEGELFLLQTRNGKRTGAAAVKVAVDMVQEKLIKEDEAINRVTPDQLDQIFHPMIDPKGKKNNTPLTRGLNASPGAATGMIIFTADEAESWAEKGKKVILVRKETSPEDIGGMHAAQGVLTSTGGMTSHAAVVARGMGIPCVVGAKSVSIASKSMTIGKKKYKEGDYITIDGTTGDVYGGGMDLIQPKISGELKTFLEWTDKIRKKAKRSNTDQVGFIVRTNADTPADAKKARVFGAEGIGLCRTEHMFFEGEKLLYFRQMIVAEDIESRKKALKKLLPLQKKDFRGIFKAMEGLPVNIRLLDPPLHEFVPKSKKEIDDLASFSGVSANKIKTKASELSEQNPMLGHRGCRLGVTYPEIYDMQVEAIITAACDVAKSGAKVFPEIMIPLVGSARELEILRDKAIEVAESVLDRRKMRKQVKYQVGTMIEVPRAALTAEEIAEHADFFSFGTNDLTQMTLGMSRDDMGSFLPTYQTEAIYSKDPFAELDQTGVGSLIELAIEKGRSVKNGLKMGICGEHGGNPPSIDFCFRSGMNYVSCSPYRVPIARLAAAQSAVSNK